MSSTQKSSAFGAPGATPHWAHGDKDGIGTATGGASPVWFTTWRGAVTEVYYPTVDRPQMRDLYFIISDGETVHDETKDLDCEVERIDISQGYDVRRRAPDGRYTLEKQIISDPAQSCVVQRNRFSGDLSNLKCYVICNPRVEGGGWGNNARTLYSGDRCLLTAERDGRWLVVAAEPGFERTSCGYAGASDGATDVHQHRRMEWEFDQAENGNVCLAGEIDLSRHPEFTIVIAFGETLHSAATAALHSLSVPFEAIRNSFVDSWRRAAEMRHDA